ncbi:hypothetical protein ACFRMQ_10730 [Kitasatospora sp. NPDC056783]|uniref:hypothetical protein n=1 Tax=Kitasatospora sp. NPDC056783 TaxID=3345943 RepID=UPI0036A8A845
MNDAAELGRPIGSHAAHELADAAQVFAYAMNHHWSYRGMDDPDLREIAAVLRDGLARLADALESGADLADERPRGAGPDGGDAAAWREGRELLLKARDAIARAVPEDFDEEGADDWPGDPVARLNHLRKARFRTYPR